MKRLLIKLLNLLGLVTARRYALAAAKLREAEGRADKMTKLLGEARAEAHGWKIKANEAIQRGKAVEKDLARQMALAKDYERDVDKRRNEVEKHKRESDRMRAEVERIRKTIVDLEQLRGRLAGAEHEIAVAREHLMAVDVKLDILEGAANVLDSRTRAVVAQQAGETNAPV